MTRIEFQIDDETAQVFSEFSKRHGGKSAVLRQFIKAALRDNYTPSPKKIRMGARRLKLQVELEEDETRAVKKEAASLDMLPAQWLRSLILSHIDRGAHYPKHVFLNLHDIRAEAAMIGSNLNQLARAVNRARLNGEEFKIDRDVVNKAAKAVQKLELEMRGHMLGNVEYWLGDAQ